MIVIYFSRFSVLPFRYLCSCTLTLNMLSQFREQQLREKGAVIGGNFTLSECRVAWGSQVFILCFNVRALHFDSAFCFIASGLYFVSDRLVALTHAIVNVILLSHSRSGPLENGKRAAENALPSQYILHLWRILLVLPVSVLFFLSIQIYRSSSHKWSDLRDRRRCWKASRMPAAFCPMISASLM